MDPISVIGLAGSLVGISDVIARSLRRLINLQSRYRSASLVVSLPIGQLSTLKSALNQVRDFVTSSLKRVPRHEQLVADFGVSLESGKLLITALEEHIDHVEINDNGSLHAKGKVGRTTFERNALLQDDESRRIIKRMEDNRASLLSLADSSSNHTRRSRITENSNLLDTAFGFDNEVITTDVYRAALSVTTGDSSAPKATDRPEYLGSGSGLVPTTPLHDGLVLESPQELPALRRCFQTDGALRHTTEVDRFSSRLSRVSSLLGRSDNASVFSFQSQAQSEKEKPNRPLSPTSKPLPKPKTARRHLRTQEAPAERSGNSGKSALFRSIDALHQSGLSLEERLQYKEAVFMNTIQNMRDIIQAMAERLDLSLNESTNQRHVRTILRSSSSFSGNVLFSDVSQAIEALWNDEGVQQAFERSNEYLLQDSAAYFSNSVRRTSEHDHIPTDEDVRRARIRSTGSFSTIVKSSGITFRLFDTGGERSERKKWILEFEYLSILIFVVDISAYDLVLYEDHSVNRMQESLVLFDSLCNSRWFVNSDIILLFTKVDVLEQKFTKVPIGRYFLEFTGKESNLNDVKENRFLSLNRHPTKIIHVRFVSLVGEYNDSATKEILNDIVSGLSAGLDIPVECSIQ
ncbi:Guanine nucleotide-binding protein subunit alpha [Lachnellula occidentalis]|uniref:Guanine nucleotide-binding protein subunit alpha n=1 Tax=Lachnellula occidentalis TaxID=215460 RepID=A0A8H8UK05_9HELO|nr:Guanine nucleotide-binding protein subunit alpha [Lachnellula occidentalis]